MRGGPFSTNLRRMFRRKSDGGAGADHAEEMMERERTAEVRELRRALAQIEVRARCAEVYATGTRARQDPANEFAMIAKTAREALSRSPEKP